MNLEKQVDGLYPIGTDKRRTLAITKVMKGALSVSKSRTGEAIYRSNEFHKKKLEKKVKQFSSAAKTEISACESKKRNISQRFSIMFGKHKATNEAITEYDDMISKALRETDIRPPTSILKRAAKKDIESETEDENEDNENDKGISPQSQENVKNIQNSLEEAPRKKSVFIPTGILLPLRSKSFGRLKFHNEPEEPKEEEVVEEVKEVWPLEDTEKYDKFIKTQKDRHEVLVTRNILKKIKTNITGKDILLRFQTKSMLTEDPDFVRKLTSAKTTPMDLFSEEKRTQQASKNFKKYVSSLPSLFPLKGVVSNRCNQSQKSARIFPELKPGPRSVKSTGRVAPLFSRSGTMPF